MNISKKEIFLILGLVGIAAAVLVYLNVYKPSMQKFEKLSNENSDLTAEVARLEGLVTQRELFIEETENVNKEAQELLEQFPANITPEDTIRQAIEIDTDGNVDIARMSYGSQKSVYNMIAKSSVDMPSQTTSASVVGEGEEGDDSKAAEANAKANKKAAESSGVQTILQPLSITYNGSLDQFLQIVRFINNQNNRDVINNVSLAYDSSTGLLSTQMTLNKYYIVGLDREEDYQPATFTAPTGSKNLFSTYVSGSGAAANNSGNSNSEGDSESSETSEEGNTSKKSEGSASAQ